MTSRTSINAACSSLTSSQARDLKRSGPRIPSLEKSQAGISADFKPNIWIIISGNLGCGESNAGG